MQHKENSVILYGAGGHCKVVIDILNILGIKIDKIIDDHPSSSEFLGIKLSQPKSLYDESLIITIGDCKTRKTIASTINTDKYITVIHPSAIVSPSAKIGKGSVIVHGAIIQAEARVGNHCIVNTKASVGHDVTINDFVHIASGATICGGSTIGECTWLGAGSVVKQGVSIGKNCMIGVGSVVVNDIPNNVVAYGNPCKVIRNNI